MKDLTTWTITCEAHSNSAFDSDISAMSHIPMLAFCVAGQLLGEVANACAPWRLA